MTSRGPPKITSLYGSVSTGITSEGNHNNRRVAHQPERANERLVREIQQKKQVALLLQKGRADALCPSVVSLNKIITRAESFIIVT